MSSPTLNRSGPITRHAASERRDVYSPLMLLNHSSIWDEFATLLREMWSSSLLAISPNSFLDSIWKIVPMVGIFSSERLSSGDINNKMRRSLCVIY